VDLIVKIQYAAATARGLRIAGKLAFDLHETLVGETQEDEAQDRHGILGNALHGKGNKEGSAFSLP
jgi:hypothetical protein